MPYEGDVSGDAEDLDLVTVKKKLCKELAEIWKLDENDKKRALRRLYLKWHPDKNPQNATFAEKVFKFLLSQIEQGLPLDDPIVIILLLLHTHTLADQDGKGTIGTGIVQHISTPLMRELHLEVGVEDSILHLVASARHSQLEMTTFVFQDNLKKVEDGYSKQLWTGKCSSWFTIR